MATGNVVRIRVTGSEPVTAPVRSDGTSYRYELIYEGGWWRAYADELDALVTALVPEGWSLLDYAVRAQVLLQARINVQEGMRGCDAEQESVLVGSRDEPPVLESWSAPVPLVLIEDCYAPHTELPRPQAVGDGHIVWLKASNPKDMLLSLAAVGAVSISERSD